MTGMRSEDCEKFVRAFEALAERCRDLTDRQREVAQLVADGIPVKAIGPRLGVSERRVRHIIDEIAIAWDLDASRDSRIQIAVRFVRCAA